MNEGEHYQFSTESNEIAPVKSTFIYIPREAPIKKEVKYKYVRPKVQYQAPQELPVDLSLLKQGQKVLPVDVSLINPIEIDLSKETQDTQQKELSQEELKKFLDDYYKGAYNLAGEDEFRPTALPPPEAQKPNQKPVTTPGLSSYSTQLGYSYPKPVYDRRNSVRPVQFPATEEEPSVRKRTPVRYTRKITYHHEEEK